MPRLESVRRGVQAPWSVFHSEIKSEELADPLVLRYRGEMLVEHEFQRKVVDANNEEPPLEVRPPMANGLDQADEFTLIGCDLQEEVRGPVPW